MTFNQYLQSVEACKPAVAWAGNKTIDEVVATCHRGDWLLWLAQKCDIGLQPLTLAKGHCANTVRHLMNDERSIRAVDVAIAFGEGKATSEELDDVAYAAKSAAKSAAAAAAAAADAAKSAAKSAANAACAAYDAANAACAADAYDAAKSAAYAAAHAAANRLQTADICRKYIGELIVEKVNQILTQTP
jgi:hypothetical protein